ncbi:hypothetical protein BJ165DRAFT_1531651 [Panaeolus papilionaceus]|nr:hypothetical protein BJ165DRAFT_1531651 [Panaeolus papilionaceus]
MPKLPPISKLEIAAKKLVWLHAKQGDLKDWTPRLIREKLEEDHGLEEGSLDEPEYKTAIKNAAKEAAEEYNSNPSVADDVDEDVLSDGTSNSTGRLTKKRKSSGALNSNGKTKGKAKQKVVENDGEQEEEEAEGEQPSAKKKRKISTTKAKKVAGSDNESGSDHPSTPEPVKRGKKSKAKQQFKSLEHVATSDIEQDEPSPIRKRASPSKAKASRPLSSATSSKAKASPASKVSPKKAKATKGPKVVESDAEEIEAVKSESEMSVLFDDPPPKKRRAKGADKETKSAKSKAPKGSKGAALSKDEETIKRLKAMVVACGTRRVWSKVFQGLDTPQQQIKKLKDILAELGMTGRLSLDKAKAIKMQREFAQELEDVVEFEKKIVGRGSRSSAASDAKSEGDQDSEEDEAPVRRRPTNARKSIMAFLEDQSEDSE